MGLSPRYVSPSFNRKPFGCHQFNVFSPKLSRQLLLFGLPAVHLWTMLESDPDVVSFCERPLQLPDVKPMRAVDFWVKSKSQEEFLVITKSDEGNPSEQRKDSIDGIALRYVSSDQTNSNAILLENWGWIIRDLSAFQRFVPELLFKEILAVLEQGKSIAQLQTELPEQDSSIVKIAVYALLHRGQVVCKELGTQLLSLDHRIEAL